MRERERERKRERERERESGMDRYYRKSCIGGSCPCITRDVSVLSHNISYNCFECQSVKRFFQSHTNNNNIIKNQFLLKKITSLLQKINYLKNHLKR